VDDGKVQYASSGGVSYKPDQLTIFDSAPEGVYLAERIGTDGKLGDRTTCALRGPDGSKVANGHRYIVHDRLTPDEYALGKSKRTYQFRYLSLCKALNYQEDVVETHIVNNEEELEQRLKEAVDQGYEGIMMKDLDWRWKRTSSRTAEFLKYKKRPTADLMCVGYVEGLGKYDGMIGSLILKDSEGRTVSVGAGLSDQDRDSHPLEFMGRVIEIEYEQILDTYIQPVFITVREYKEID